MENNFWTPKSIFKGKRADGSDYKVTEWEFGSIGSFTNQNDNVGFGIVMAMCFFLLTLSISTPLTLLYCAFKYDGKIQKASVFAIISSLYFLFDLHKKWIVYIINDIVFGQEILHTLTAITIASLVCHLILVIGAIITKGDMFNNINKEDNQRNSGILFIVLVISFIVSYKIFI